MTMFRSSLLWLAALACLAPLPGRAEEPTTLDLSTVGTADGTPDILVATLESQARDASPATAQAKVNSLGEAAKHGAAGLQGITLGLGAYSVSQDERREGQPQWSAHQEITVSGADSSRLLPFVSKLQGQGFLLQDLAWTLAPRQRDTLRAKARDAGLHQLREDAEASARSLGLRFIGFKSVRIDAQSPIRPMLMMARSAAAPDRTNTPESVRVEVSGTALLAP